MSARVDRKGFTLSAKTKAKIDADARNDRNGFEEARRVCETRLRDLGVPLVRFQPTVASLTADSAEALDAEAVRRVRGEASALPPGAARHLAEVVDLFERVGISYTHAYEAASAGPKASWNLRVAYLWFRMARVLGVTAPGVDRTKPSGNSSRVFVRCCMYLASGTGPNDPGNRALYLRRARQILTRLTFRMFRYPSERAAALILEASFARLVSTDNRMVSGVPKDAALRRAAELLRKAEDLLPEEASRPRLRLRFLLERVDLALAVGEMLHAERGDASGHAEVAEGDLNDIASLVERGNAHKHYDARIQERRARAKALLPKETSAETDVIPPVGRAVKRKTPKAGKGP